MIVSWTGHNGTYVLAGGKLIFVAGHPQYGGAIVEPREVLDVRSRVVVRRDAESAVLTLLAVLSGTKVTAAADSRVCTLMEAAAPVCTVLNRDSKIYAI